MGLDPNDRIRERLPTRKAYLAVFNWYKSNRGQLETRDWEAEEVAWCGDLIDALPAPQQATELEIIAIMNEVIGGGMEWAYHEADDRYKMGAYAHAMLESLDRGLSLSEAEIKELRKSRLGPHLTCSRRGAEG